MRALNVRVSVILSFFREWVIGPSPNPQPGGPVVFCRDFPSLSTQIGCWNVRTLNEVGRTAILTEEMRKYNLSILGVSELRWTDHGKLRTSTGESVLFSGSEDRHERGVALFLAKALEECLIEWEPVNERIIRGRFYGKQLNTTIIQIYAPTNEADPEDKEEFYEQLSKITEKYQDKIYLLLWATQTPRLVEKTLEERM